MYRPTVQTNATWVFLVYQISDCLMIAAAALSATADDVRSQVAAFALVTGALIKTSQVRSERLVQAALI